MGLNRRWILVGAVGVMAAGGAAWYVTRPTEVGPPPVLSPVVSAVPTDHSQDLIRVTNAARQYPHNAELAVEAGALTGDQGQYSEALRWFEKAARINPKLLPALTGQGQMWMALGRPGRAAAKYEEARKLAPEVPQLHLELARAYLALRDFPLALQAARAAERLSPENPGVQRALALIYTEVLDPNQARKSAERACELDGEDPENWATLGSLELRNSRYPEAEAALKRALALDPGHVSANLLYARVLTDSKKTPEAEREAFEVLARLRVVDPQNAQALLQQSQILLRAGKAPLAISLLRQAREAAPRDSAILLALGQALGRAGQVEEGVRLTAAAQRLAPKGVAFLDLEELVAKNPDPALVQRLADLYVRQNMHDSAIRALERATKRLPQHAGLRAKLRKVQAAADSLLSQ